MEEENRDGHSGATGFYDPPGESAPAPAGVASVPRRRGRPIKGAGIAPAPVTPGEAFASQEEGEVTSPPWRKQATEPSAPSAPRGRTGKKAKAVSVVRSLLKQYNESLRLLSPQAAMSDTEILLIEPGLVAHAEQNPDFWLGAGEYVIPGTLILGGFLYARRMFYTFGPPARQQQRREEVRQPEPVRIVEYQEPQEGPSRMTPADVLRMTANR